MDLLNAEPLLSMHELFGIAFAIIIIISIVLASKQWEKNKDNEGKF